MTKRSLNEFTEKLNSLIDELQGLESEFGADDEVITVEQERALVAIRRAGEVVKGLEEVAKSAVMKVMKEHVKLKRYEGELVQIGYREVKRKYIDGTPDTAFIQMTEKPDTKAINAYYHSTGELPIGIKEKVFEYVTFKPIVINEEDEETES